MMWLLILIQLQVMPNDAFVKHAEVIKIFHSEAQCQKEVRKIFKDASEQGNPPPKTVNFGCVKLKGTLI